MKHEVKQVKREVKREVRREVEREFRAAATGNLSPTLRCLLMGMEDAHERLKKSRRSRARRKKKKRGPLVDCYNHWKTITNEEVSRFKYGVGFDDSFMMEPIQRKNAAKVLLGLRERLGGGRIWSITKNGKMYAFIQTTKAECFVEKSSRDCDEPRVNKL